MIETTCCCREMTVVSMEPDENGTSTVRTRCEQCDKEYTFFGCYSTEFPQPDCPAEDIIVIREIVLSIFESSKEDK